MLARIVLLVENATENAGRRMPEEAMSPVAGRWDRYPPDEASTLRGERTQLRPLHVVSKETWLGKDKEKVGIRSDPISKIEARVHGKKI